MSFTEMNSKLKTNISRGIFFELDKTECTAHLRFMSIRISTEISSCSKQFSEYNEASQGYNYISLKYLFH